MKYFPLLCTFFSLTHAISAQENYDSLIQKFELYHGTVASEKVYIHTNREVMTLGDTIWYSAYVRNGATHQVADLSKLLYVDFISPADTLMESHAVFVDSLGHGRGQIALKDSYLAGSYQIRAYTNYQRNFDEGYLFKKDIKVLPRMEFQKKIEAELAPDYAYDFQLFPEGGQLVSGMLNYVAVKVVDAQGDPIRLRGQIKNDLNEVVGFFESNYDGMGKFQLKIEPGRKYSCAYEVEGVPFSYSFPEILDSGYLLNVRKTTNKTYLTVSGNNVQWEYSFLVIQHRGRIVQVVKPSTYSDYLYVALDNEKLPNGILQATFFNSFQTAVAERLFFNESSQSILPVDISLDQEQLKTRSTVKVDYQLKKERNWQSVSGVISASIIPADLYIDPLHSISSYFLLSSDLVGEMPRPAYYLDRDNANREQYLDLIMMINGWRRFRWEDISNGQYPEIKLLPEQGFTLEGQVVEYYNRRKTAETDIYLSFLEDPSIQITTSTDDEGYFKFESLDVQDSVNAFLKTISTKEKRRDKDQVNRNTYIKITEQEKPIVQSSRYPDLNLYETDEEIITRGQKLFDIQSVYGENVIVLDELSVKGTVTPFDDPFVRDFKVYSKPDNRVVLDSINNFQSFTSIFELLRGRVPGLQVSGFPPNQTLLLRGFNSLSGSGSEPLFLFDGMMVDAEFIGSVLPQDVLFVDVLKGASAAIFGSRAAAGVIALYSRRGDQYGVADAEPVGFTMRPMVGYFPARDFYAPNYNNPTDDEKVSPDFRSTLHWNPIVRLTSGKASDLFFTSDEKGEFVLRVEGIMDDGQLIQSVHRFMVK
ncbi:MAG: hypothetical protein ACI8QD_002131 [Cyclobacteriaceae bacterium]|jgi:hypothetical protein